MLTLPRTLTLTPSQFAEVCAANPEAVLELAADGTLIEVTPTGGSTGARNQTLGALLWLAIEQSRLPLKLFDSSAGFLLPVAARLLRRSWLRTQPRRKRRAAGSLAGVERGRTGWIPAPLPRSGGGAGQPFRWAAGPAPQDGRLHGQWSQFGMAVADAKPHGGGVEGRGSRNSLRYQQSCPPCPTKSSPWEMPGWRCSSKCCRATSSALPASSWPGPTARSSAKNPRAANSLLMGRRARSRAITAPG